MGSNLMKKDLHYCSLIEYYMSGISQLYFTVWRANMYNLLQCCDMNSNVYGSVTWLLPCPVPQKHFSRRSNCAPFHIVMARNRSLSLSVSRPINCSLLRGLLSCRMCAPKIIVDTILYWYFTWALDSLQTFT